MRRIENVFSSKMNMSIGEIAIRRCIFDLNIYACYIDGGGLMKIPGGKH